MSILFDVSKEMSHAVINLRGERYNANNLNSNVIT